MHESMNCKRFYFYFYQSILIIGLGIEAWLGSGIMDSSWIYMIWGWGYE